MFTHVNKVLVGKATTATTVDTMAIGEIAVFDKNGNIVPNAAAAVTGEPFMIGIAEDILPIALQDGTIVNKTMIRFGNVIDVCGLTNEPKLVPFKAPVEDIVTVDFTNVFCTVDYRYVVRVLYDDIYWFKNQYTKSYEVVATATDTPATLATRLAAEINKDPYRRVVATVAGTLLTLTALPKTDNPGKDTINTYSQVRMTVSLYATDTKSFIGNPIETGAIITKTQTADPGDGNPKVIRDRERDSLGYMGVTNLTLFPIKKPELNVDMTAQYSTIVVEYDHCYRSNDNQYVKNTPKTDEIYIDETSNAASIWAIVEAYLGL